MNNKFRLIIVVYILLTLILNVFGFIGDSSKETTDLALKYFTETDIETGISLFRQRLVISLLYSVLVILFLFYLVSGAWQKISSKLLRVFRSEYAALFISLLIIYIVLMLLRFPFSLYSGFYLGKQYALIKADVFTWSLRFFSSSIIFIFLFSILILLFALIIRKTKRYILYIPLAFFLFGMLYIYIYPRFITPLFYKTEVLSDNNLKIKIKNLFEKSGLLIEDIYVIKTSVIHSSANAYMIGTGPTRRVVLYDTLLKKFTDAEILSIIAHEAGHYDEEHMTIGLIIGSIALMLVIIFLNKTSDYLTGKDLKNIFTADGVPLLIILIMLISFVASPVGNSISRYMENRADAYSLKLTEDPDAYINLSVRLRKINKSNIIPNRVYTAFYSTHPRALDRIKRAEDFKRNNIIKFDNK